MNFNKLMLPLVLMLMPVFAYSQIKIGGKLTDDAGTHLESIEVLLLHTDSIILKNSMTDKDGSFHFSVDKGMYILQARMLGTVLYSKSLEADSTIDLGIIRLQASTRLKEVEIRSVRKLIERKVDRLVFNVENSVMATGGDAVDALKIAPGLKVRETGITMIGKSGMSVMVDGRIVALSGEELINYLRTFRAGDIKNIEIITNPPSSYEAEGNSGIININMKKAAPDSWNAGLNSSIKQSAYATTTNGGDFNYQHKKISLYSSLNYTIGSKKGIEQEEIRYPEQQWNTEYIRRVYADILSGRAGLDYNVTSKWVIGAQILGSYSKPLTKQRNSTGIMNNASGRTDSLIRSASRDHKNITSGSFNLHSIFKLDTAGKNLAFDADYLTYDNQIRRNFNSQNLFSNLSPTPGGYRAAENEGFQGLDIYSLKLDVTHPLKWINLTYGAKVYFSTTDYDNQFFDLTSASPVLQLDQSNVFRYIENTQAIYISGNRKIWKKWNVKLGWRIERTQTEGNSVTLNQVTKNNYLQLFPTAFLQYNVSQNNVFALNYGRRLSRPRYNELNPFKVYYNPYSYTQGNPLLLPAFTNNVELQHSYKDFLFTALSFSRTTNGTGNPPFFDENTKVQYLLDLNYYTLNSYNFSETFVYNKLNWWESETQANIFYNKTVVTKAISLQGTKGFGAYISTNNSFTLNKTKSLKAELSFWYQSAQYEDIYKKRSQYGLDLGARYDLLKSRLQLAVVVQDVLRSDIDRAHTALSRIRYSYSDYNDNRFCRISLSYKIGSSTISLNPRKPGNEEESRRTN